MNLIKRSLDIRNGFLKWLTFNYILKAGWNFHNWRWEHRKNHCVGGWHTQRPRRRRHDVERSAVKASVSWSMAGTVVSGLEGQLELSQFRET